MLVFRGFSTYCSLFGTDSKYIDVYTSETIVGWKIHIKIQHIPLNMVVGWDCNRCVCLSSDRWVLWILRQTSRRKSGPSGNLILLTWKGSGNISCRKDKIINMKKDWTWLKWTSFFSKSVCRPPSPQKKYGTQMLDFILVGNQCFFLSIWSGADPKL